MHGVQLHVANVVKTQHYSCGKFEIFPAVMFGSMYFGTLLLMFRWIY